MRKCRREMSLGKKGEVLVLTLGMMRRVGVRKGRRGWGQLDVSKMAKSWRYHSWGTMR